MKHEKYTAFNSYIRLLRVHPVPSPPPLPPLPLRGGLFPPYSKYERETLTYPWADMNIFVVTGGSTCMVILFWTDGHIDIHNHICVDSQTDRHDHIWRRG